MVETRTRALLLQGYRVRLTYRKDFISHRSGDAQRYPDRAKRLQCGALCGRHCRKPREIKYAFRDEAYPMILGSDGSLATLGRAQECAVQASWAGCRYSADQLSRIANIDASSSRRKGLLRRGRSTSSPSSSAYPETISDFMSKPSPRRLRTKSTPFIPAMR